jgi:ferredoxin-type protein NapF
MNLAKPKYIRRISTVVAVALAIPLNWKLLTGLSIWLSPFVMLNSLFMLKSMVLLNLAGWTILVISFFKNRWFCLYMCPVGLGCDSFSKWGRKGHKTVQKIPRLGKWLAILSLSAALTGIPLFILLDPLAIFNGFFAAFTTEVTPVVVLSLIGLPLLLVIHLFLPGIWCSKFCPLGGLFDEMTLLRKWLLKKYKKEQRSSSEIAFGRRIFIASGTGLLAGVFIPKVLKSNSSVFFRPPASSSEDVFNILCVRCGNCIKACPTNIIKHHTGKEDLTKWMTPEVTFQNKGYCLEDCNLCGTVCPTGSISPFSIDAKKKLFIGSIEIGLEKCLLTELKECDRCKSVCSYHAIEIVPAGNSVVMKPVADLSKCVGCGACAAICPTETIWMTPLNTKTHHEINQL